MLWSGSSMSEQPSHKWMSVSHDAHGEAEPFTEIRLAIPFGFPALFFAFASMAMCTGPAVAEFLFDLPENSLDPNPHVQALLMSVLGLISVVAMWRDSKTHHRRLPVALGVIGVASMVATLYIRYHAEIEALSYALLAVAAILNLHSFAGMLSQTAQFQAKKIELLNQVVNEKLRIKTDEIDRLSLLKQLVPPPVADLVVGAKSEEALRTHRRYVACLFCDLRGFTAFSDDAEPEEVIAVLNEYHGDIDRLAGHHNGTIGFRAGDGIMVFFNDPLPCDEPVLSAVRLALEAHCVNIAARLCASANDGQILMSQRAHADVAKQIDAEILPAFAIKGIAQPVTTYSVLAASAGQQKVDQAPDR
jgi:class 3 adenylate cyclase